MRAVQEVAALGPRHEVTLLTPEPGPGAPLPPAGLPCAVRSYRTSGLPGKAAGVLRAAFSGRPLQCGLFRHSDLARQLRRLAPAADLVLLHLVRLAGHLPDLGGAPLLVDFIDSLSLNLERRARFDRAWLVPALAFEAARLRRWEARLLARASRGLLVCERDRAAMAGGLPSPLAGRLAVVPLWVEPGAAPEPAGSAPRWAGAGGSAGREELAPIVALTGNLGYFPNRDAARWFLARVWPELVRRRPGVRLLLAGSRLPSGLARAARRAGAELFASPPDVAAVLGRATVAVAPLRAGSGLPLKILEAWAAGVPVVASPWAAAGTSAVPGEDLLVASEPSEWLAALLLLLADAEERRRLAAAGRRRLASDYGRAEVERRLLAAVEPADRSAPS